MKKQFIISTLLLVFFLASNISYSQETKMCKGYIIIQEVSFLKTGMKSIDSIFLTENYYYSKYATHTLPSKLIDHKNKILYAIINYSEGKPRRDKIERPVAGNYVLQTDYFPDTVCDESINYLGEQKEIAGYRTQKVQIPYVSPISGKVYSSVAYIADKKLDPNQSKCIPGFILELDNISLKTRTLKIIETMLPENADFILRNTRDIKELEAYLGEVRDAYPWFPTGEDIKRLAEELYSD